MFIQSLVLLALIETNEFWLAKSLIIVFLFLKFLNCVFCFLLKHNPHRSLPKHPPENLPNGWVWEVLGGQYPMKTHPHTQTNSPTKSAHKEHKISSGLPPRTPLLLYQSLVLTMFKKPNNPPKESHFCHFSKYLCFWPFWGRNALSTEAFFCFLICRRHLSTEAQNSNMSSNTFKIK